MRNKQGKTASERIKRDIEHARTIENTEQRKLYAYMIIGSVEFAIDFGLITYTEWKKYTHAVFGLM